MFFPIPVRESVLYGIGGLSKGLESKEMLIGLDRLGGLDYLFDSLYSGGRNLFVLEFT